MTNNTKSPNKVTVSAATGAARESAYENFKGYQISPSRITLKAVQAAITGALVGAFVAAAISTVLTSGIAAVAAAGILLAMTVAFIALLDLAFDELIDSWAPLHEKE